MLIGGERRREAREPRAIMGTSMVHMVHKHITAATLDAPQKGKRKTVCVHVLGKSVIIVTISGTWNTRLRASSTYLDQRCLAHHSQQCTVQVFT